MDGLQSALDGKASSSHTHNYAGSSSAGGAANSAVKLATARNISLTGDVTGNVDFDGSGDVVITATVKDDSHNHTIANVNGLQSALDGKLGSCSTAAAATKLATARNLNGINFNGTANAINYGTCSTAAGTAAKTVSCSNFTLVTGAEITVKFTVTNTASNPTLNVNGTGAKPIYYRGSAISAGYLAANRTYSFRYNGTQYDLVGDIDTNTTYSLSSLGVTAIAAELNHLDGITSTVSELNKLHGLTATTAELNYVDGVTSNIQTQLNGKASSSHNHVLSALTGTLDASKLTGTIDVARLPAAALERCVVVADDAARYKLTTANVQLGDTVKVTSSGLMYVVTNTAELDNAAGYTVYSAGTAAQVPWSGVTGKPSTFTPSSHTHNYAGSSSAGGAANSAVKLSAARTITLGGDASGSVSFDGSANVTLSVTVKDDSHNHTIANVDGLQSALDGKLSTSGTAAKATADATGQNIADTYIKSLSVSGRTITYTKGDGGTGTITTQDTNNLVTQKNATADQDKRILLSATQTDTEETSYVCKSNNFTANPVTGAFYAKGFQRIDLTGKTQDLNALTLSSGEPMAMYYIEKTSGGAANITCGTSEIPVPDQPFTLDVELIRWSSSTDYIIMQTFKSTTARSTWYVRTCANGTWSDWTTMRLTYSLSTFGITATAAELNKLDGVTATAAEINYLDGVTSNIQTQLNGKLSTSGTAAKATADANGQNIADTYIKALSLSSNKITYTKGDGGTGSLTLGTAAAKGVTDSTAAGAIGTGTNLVTERDVYYGLPKINNVHTYTSNTSIFAPTSGGTANQVLKSNGSTATPTWANAADLISTFDCGDEG